MQICNRHLLVEKVGKPTRGEYLLDLVLSNLDVQTSVLPKVADHSMVVAVLEVPRPSARVIERQVWDFKKADWDGLRSALSETDWHSILCKDADAAAEGLTETLLSKTREYVPTRRLKDEKSSHPWINDRCRRAISEKDAAENSDFDSYKRACERCTAVLQEEYGGYIQRLRTRLQELPAMSKQWWDINRQLMNNAPPREAIPPLKLGGVWDQLPGRVLR